MEKIKLLITYYCVVEINTKDNILYISFYLAFDDRVVPTNVPINRNIQNL